MESRWCVESTERLENKFNLWPGERIDRKRDEKKTRWKEIVQLIGKLESGHSGERTMKRTPAITFTSALGALSVSSAPKTNAPEGMVCDFDYFGIGGGAAACCCLAARNCEPRWTWTTLCKSADGRELSGPEAMPMMLRVT